MSQPKDPKFQPGELIVDPSTIIHGYPYLILAVVDGKNSWGEFSRILRVLTPDGLVRNAPYELGIWEVFDE